MVQLVGEGSRAFLPQELVVKRSGLDFIPNMCGLCVRGGSLPVHGSG